MRRLLRAWIGTLARLVPAASRREFRAEWDAELATDPSMRRASGAAADAWFLRRQAWSLDSWLDDVRYAVRVLARRPAYTSLVLVTLAIGIGATTAVFSAIDTVLLRPLPYPDSARLVTVWENDRINRPLSRWNLRGSGADGQSALSHRLNEETKEWQCQISPAKL